MRVSSRPVCRPLRRAISALFIASLSVPVSAAVSVPAAHAAVATVANGISTTDLAAPTMNALALATALVGSGVSVSNATFTGLPQQAGLLHIVDPAVVSFNDGLILSSGNIADIVGPNKSDGTTGDMGTPGDSDLDKIITGTQTVDPHTYDAAVLEFDFVPSSSTVYFTYTFGSDEYLEWVNLFNDVFAFYVNGTNCATIPSGDAVSINTINSSVNAGSFRDNSFSSPPANPINIESDGLSVELICSAPVNAGQTNHMKLAVADTSDHILDSVVMIKSASLSTVKPEACNDGVDNDDDTLVDDSDPSCSGSTTPAPPGNSGVGSDSSAPAFTGNAGSPIVLDAAAFGWTPDPEALSTSWQVHLIKDAAVTCTVSPAGKQAIVGGVIATAEASCPVDGEYVARVDGWDGENKSAFDYDVDFFVHNAPPALTVNTPTANSSATVGSEVSLSATLTDTGDLTAATCAVDWGDGTSSAGVIADGECTASHTFSTTGWTKIGVSATDADGATSAAALALEVVAAPSANTAPTSNAGGPYSGTEGSDVNIVGTAGDVDGDTLSLQWTAAVVSGADSAEGCVFASGSSASTTVRCSDDGTYSLTLSVSDGTTTTQSSATFVVAGRPKAARGNRRAELVWDRNAWPELPAVTDYLIERSTNGGRWTRISDGVNTKTSVSFSSLVNGRRYRYRVAAQNGSVRGAWLESNTVVPSTVPGSPLALVVRRSGTTARLSWRAPRSNGGAAVSDYRIQWSTDRSNWTDVVHPVSAQRSITVSELVPGTRYWFRVAAVNVAGQGRFGSAR